MANYTVYGYIKDTECNPVVGASVYPYFKKVDSGSPDSKWADSAYETDADGYYSFNLGDNALLGSEASFKKGTDKIYISVVSGNDQSLDSIDMSFCMFFSHTTTSEESNELNLNIEERRRPIIDNYFFPNAINTNTIYSMSEASRIDSSWSNNGCYDVYVSQKFMYDGIEIFNGHQMVDSVYSWGEKEDKTVQNSGSDTYSFEAAGVYDLKIKVYEKWNTFSIVESQVTIKYNEPDVNFSWTPVETNNWQGSRIKGKEEVTFINGTSDIDSRSETEYYYKWTIHDLNQDGSDNTKIYSSKSHSFSPSHTFNSDGEKEIVLSCYWNDGFDDRISTIEKTIVVYPFDIVVDFEWSPEIPSNRGQNVIFNPDTTHGDTGSIISFSWEIEDWYPKSDPEKYTFLESEQSKFGEGTQDNTVIIENTYSINNEQYPEVKFHNSSNKVVKLTIVYDDGWKNVSKERIKTISFTEYAIDADFSILNSTPVGREDTVSFNDETVDDNSLSYHIDWTVNDAYDVYNPDNPNYGISEEDNTKYIFSSPVQEQINHNFQSEVDHEIKEVLYYDNGWQMVSSVKSKRIDPKHKDVSASFITSPEYLPGAFVGMTSIEYINSTEDSLGVTIDVNWEWIDRSGISSDEFTETRVNEPIDKIQEYIFKYPSRVPLSSLLSNTSTNENKSVKMSVRYDNGWTDVNISEAEHQYEASPNEISGEITMQCNIHQYSH